MKYNFKGIKEHYEEWTPMIMEVGKRNLSGWVTPYSSFVDWTTMFSPIEVQTWMALRCFGKCPLYPQYPVDKFYTDFGNPFVKVAIECDGKEWHTDKEKDKKRDEILSNLGWSVYRISGSDCVHMVDDTDLYYQSEDENIEILHDYFDNTIEGLIESIAIFHFGYKTYNRYVNKYDLAYNCLSKRISVGSDQFEKKASKIMYEAISDIPDELKYQTNWL